MKHTKQATAALFTILLVLLACTSRKAESGKAAQVTAAPVAAQPTAPAPPMPPPAATVEIVAGTPPATSELALLMRAMADYTDSTRRHLAEGADLLPFPTRFSTLRTAEATPGMVERTTFDPYAQAWQYHLNRLYEVPQPERIGVFNALVSTCAACHGQMCPGPLVRIQKMGLPEQ